MPFKGPERRNRTRFRVRLPFTLKSNGDEVRGTTRNISLLGISAYTNRPLPQVQPVQCLLELPEKPQPLVVHGTVIRCETLPEPHPDGSYEMGVFFKEFPETEESALERFLDQVAQKERQAIQEGFRALQQRLAARKRRKRQELLAKRKRRLARLRKRRKKKPAVRRRAPRRR